MRRRSMTRRRFLQRTAVVAGSVLVVGCGRVPGQEEAGPAEEQEQGEETAQGKQISFMNWDVVEGTPIGDAIKAYEQQSGNTVRIEPAPSGDEYNTKTRTVLASGAPPDIIRMNDDFIRGFSLQEQALLDLTPFIEEAGVNSEEFFEPLFDFPKQPDGTYTGWVLGVQPRLIFYNVDMFKEAGVELPPTEWTSEGWTWDDFLETAQALTVEGERWGGLIYYDTGYEQTFAVNAGEEDGIWSEDGETFTLAEPRGIDAVQWATDLTCVHGVQPPWSMLQGTDLDNQLFAQGKIAMMFNAFGAVPWLRENVTDFEWDVAPPPARVNQKTEGSLIVFTIPKDANDPETAFELLRFLSGPDGGQIFAESGAFVPIHKEAAALIRPTDQSPANIELFVEAPNYQTLPNFTANTLRARQIYRPELDRVYNCEASAEEVLNQVRPEVEAALKGEF